MPSTANASQSEWTFRVRLSDVSLRSVATSVDRPANSNPYFRCDFDGKIMQSELCTSPGDAAWTHKATFDYRLDEDGLPNVASSLAARTAVFEIFFTDGAKHALLGRASVDLFSLATGAANLQLGITARNGGPVVGLLYATVQMEHLSVVETSIAALTVHHLPEPLQVQLSYGVLQDTSAAPVQSRISQSSTDPSFERCPAASSRTSFRALLANTLRITFLDVTHNSVPIGAVDIPFSELVTTSGDNVASFKRNLYADAAYRRSFTAHVVGTVSVTNLPSFAQLATGLNVGGQIHGKPLVEGLMLPSKYSKFPSRLPDYNATSQTAAPVSRYGDSSVTANIPPAGMPITDAQLSSGRPGDASQYYNNNTNMSASSSRFARDPGAIPLARSPMRDIAPPEPLHVNALRAISPPRNRQPAPHPPRSPMGMVHSPMQPPLARTPAAAPSYAYHNTSSALPAYPAGSGLPAITALQRTKSPIATAASVLQQQHDEALSAIEAQRRRVANLTEDLRARTAAEQESERKRAEHTAAEDRTLQSRHEAATRNIEELRRAIDEGEAEANNAKRAINAERAELETELEQLAVTEAELHSFLAGLQRHAEDDARVREVARIQALEAKDRLESDMHALADFESRVALRQRQRALSPHVTSAHNSPVRHPHQVAAGVSGSPQHHYNASSVHATNNNNASSFSYTAPAPQSSSAGAASSSSALGSAAAGQLLDAITTNNDAAFHRVLSGNPDVLHRDHIWLLKACGAASPNDSIVAAILRQRPELLHMVDPLSANTPLHAACAAQRPNAGVVALLLQHGANPYAFNVNGLTPMHLALLNVNDVDHIVKRALVNKAGVGILNQPSSSGETGAHLCASNDRHLPALRFLGDQGAHMTAVALLMRDGRPMQATPRDKAVWAGNEAEGARRYLERF